MSQPSSLPSRTTWYPNSGRRRSAKFKRPSTSLKRRRPNKPRWSSSRMSRRSAISTLSWSRKTRWRTSWSTSRRGLHSWRLRMISAGGFTLWRGRLTRRWMKRTEWGKWRSRRSCKWRCLRWSWLRNCKTLRPFRRMHTLNWKRPSASPLLHWPNIKMQAAGRSE